MSGSRGPDIVRGDHTHLGVEYEECLVAVALTSYVGTIPTWLASYFRCDLPLLFVYFQVNTGVLYFLDYVKDIYVMVLSVLVSTLNLNHMCIYHFY